MPGAVKPPDRDRPRAEIFTPEEQRAGFVLRLARALQTAGTPANRLEEVLTDIASRLGLVAHFFTTPTSIFASFGPPERQRTHLFRVEPGAYNLRQLAELDDVAADVRAGRASVVEGSRRIDEILGAPPRYPWWIVLLAYGLASAAGCRFLGGGLAEIKLAFGAGLVMGGLSFALKTVALFDLVGSFVGALLVGGAVAAGYRCAISTTTLAALIVILPGLTLTLAMTELASRHLVSGTARLAGALTVFLVMIVGVAAANAVLFLAHGPVRSVPVVRLPEFTRYLALAVAPLGFGILMGARPRDIPAIYVASIVAYFGMQAGQRGLGAELGASVGSFAIGIATNGYERLRLGPASVPLTPGVLLLVPGSIGFRSVTALRDANTVAGIETAFTMFLTAAALAAGLLVANLVLPPRRAPRVGPP
jgi:uncharacterized membrane protein YjjP (DUF1212 family)